jgi:hypothetical protein
MTLPADPLKWAVAQFRDTTRQMAYRNLHRYYDGQQDLKFVSKNLADALRGIFDALTYNRCAPVVDAVADRLHLLGFTAPSGVTVKDALDLWTENRMDKRFGEILTEALTAADAYAIVWPNVRTGRPTIWPEEAQNVRVLYDDEEPGRVTMAAKYWLTPDKYGRLNLYLPDRLEKYATIAKAESGPPDLAGFERFQAETDQTWPIVYPWFRDGDINVPVFHFANNARTGRYGRSELADVIPLQDGLNTTLAKLMAASDDAATPRIVITGWTPRPNPVTGGQELNPFERPVRPFDTINEKRAAFPDANTGVQQLPMVDLSQLIALGEAFDLMIARTSRIPVHYLGMTGQFPSGEALKTADAPFTRKVMDRQTAFGNVAEDMTALALRQAGIDLAFSLEAKWEPAEARSDQEQALLAVEYSQAGLPLPSILRLALGLDEAEVAKVLNDASALVPGMAAAIGAGSLNPDLQAATA